MYFICVYSLGLRKQFFVEFSTRISDNSQVKTLWIDLYFVTRKDLTKKCFQEMNMSHSPSPDLVIKDRILDFHPRKKV